MTGRLTRALPVVWAVLLPLVLLGPVLGRGFVLSYDMVFVPDLGLRSDFWGLGTGLPRAVPSDAVVALVDEVLPGEWLQKLVLYGALLLAGLGVLRLVGSGLPGRLVAVSVAVWNPFVVERLWIGHWTVLLGYAAVPWLVAAGRRARQDGRVPAGALLPLVLGSLSASAGVVSALALLVPAWPRSTARVKVGLVLVVALAEGPWVVAGVLNSAAASTGGSAAFALRSDGSLPAPFAALGLGGIWNAETVPGSRESAWAVVSLLILAGLAGLGARRWWRRTGVAEAAPLTVLWGLGYLLALTTWAAPWAVTWLGDHVPGGGLFRDGTRALGLCVPLLVCLVAEGVDVVADRIPWGKARIAVAAAGAVFPVLLMLDAAWGIGGELQPVQYPPEYAAARAELAGAGDRGDLLVLPFSSYRAPAWNGSRKVLDPLGRFLTPNYLASDDLSVSGVVIAGEDSRSDSVRRALADPDPAARAAALTRLGVAWVAREKDAPGYGVPPYDAPMPGVVLHDGPRLQVVALPGEARQRDATSARAVSLALAWAGYLGLALLGAVRLTRKGARVDVTHGATT